MRHVSVLEMVVVVDCEVNIVCGNAVDIGLIELPSVMVMAGGVDIAIYLSRERRPLDVS